MKLTKSKIENAILVKGNRMVNAKYSLSPNELRIFIFMLASVNFQDEEFQEVIIPMELMGMYDVQNKYDKIKAVCDKFAQKSIGIETLIERGKDKGRTEYIAYSLFAYCKYKKGYGYITAKFNDHIKPFLLGLTEEFTKADAKKLVSLESFYAYRFYWFLKQFQRIGWRKFEIEKLKRMLELENNYPRFMDFKRRILLPVQEQLVNTDMAFTFNTERIGKRIHYIVFTLISNRHNEGQLGLFSNPKTLYLPTKDNSLGKTKFKAPVKASDPEYICKMLASTDLSKNEQKKVIGLLADVEIRERLKEILKNNEMLSAAKYFKDVL